MSVFILAVGLEWLESSRREWIKALRQSAFIAADKAPIFFIAAVDASTLPMAIVEEPQMVFLQQPGKERIDV
jgi:hypothetical protein